MVAHQATIGSYIPGLNDAPRGKPSKAMVAALVLVSAAHAGLFAYLAYQKFVMPQPVIEDRGFILEAPPLEPPPPKPQQETPKPEQSNPIRPHVPADPPPLATPDKLVVPVPPPSDVVGSGPPKFTFNPPFAGDPPVEPTVAKVIRSPNWLKKPGASEFSRFYPESAMRREVSGQATLACTVAANGALRDCVVAGETPAEEGFGNAAVKLSKYFRMSPQTENGQPVDGASVRIPIKFSAG
ncbi:energy transducer TonB [Caulobacter sp. Root655]|uniref:energy transducer TonB family protein n=1 Tax=Caulobacter sp. Root655 TaxID=1736578 RepID=UPI0007004FE7|nr:energy transducer TonB [Caulobacter sp. Root655]KRA63877.1 energy transducer TonB [Caulobacter sp. Root655]